MSILPKIYNFISKILITSFMTLNYLDIGKRLFRKYLSESLLFIHSAH